MSHDASVFESVPVLSSNLLLGENIVHEILIKVSMHTLFIVYQSGCYDKDLCLCQCYVALDKAFFFQPKGIHSFLIPP